MAIFGLSPFQGFDALLLRVDQPFEGFDVSLQGLNRLDSFFESFTEVLIRLAGLFQLFIFALQPFAQCLILRSELVQFFI